MKSIQKGREIEEAGLAAVRNLLRCLPGAEIAPIDQIRQVGHDHQFDGLIRVNYGGVPGCSLSRCSRTVLHDSSSVAWWATWIS